MRLLVCHADSARFESVGVETTCLVCFCTLESGERPTAVRDPACEEVRDVATHLGVETLLVVPTRHLSPRPANGATGVEAVRGTAARLDKTLDGRDVRFVPVDEQVGVELDLKGHPHARQSVRARGRVGAVEDGTGREWRLAAAEGTPVESPATALLERLQSTTDPLAGGGVAASATEVPWWDDTAVTPREQFLRDSIEARVREQTGDLAATVETGSPLRQVDGVTVQAESGLPLGCTPAVAGALRASGEREERGRCYRLVTGERHRDGGGRQDTVRRQTTPQLWAQAESEEGARQECERQVGLVGAVAEALGLDPLSVVLADESAHGEWLDGLSTETQTLLGESDGSRPWTVEVAVVCGVGDQFVRLGSTGLYLEGVDGGEPAPVVCSAVVASVERAAVAAVASARARSPGRLPAWLAPTQLRLVPTVPDEYTSVCGRLADEIEEHGARVTVDSRARSVGDRLADAAAALVPYVAVVGRGAAEGGPLRVTDRAARAQFEATPAELGERLGGEGPTRRRTFPRALCE